jgi:hypothetical protein
MSLQPNKTNFILFKYNDQTPMVDLNIYIDNNNANEMLLHKYLWKELTKIAMSLRLSSLESILIPL